MVLDENKREPVSTASTRYNRALLPCFHQELAEELGGLETSSDEDEMVTTRVVRRRVIIQVPSVERLHEPVVTGPW